MVDSLVLYDLASTRGVCFSPAVWRIRLMLNYKDIRYTTSFLEFPDIEPTLSSLGVEPNETDKRYTVPTVYIPSEQRYIMGSDSIALYIEETFPSPAVQLRSNRGDEVLKKMRQDVAIFQQRILAPREARILSPPSAEYFRRKVGSSGIEDTGADEEMVWSQAEKGFQQLSDLLLLDSGPFIEGAQPSYADFTLAGALQTIRVIDSAVLERIMRYQGQRRVYQACERWMARNT